MHLYLAILSIKLTLNVICFLKTTKSWSMSIPSTSRQSDTSWASRIHEYVASTKLCTTNLGDEDFNENLRRCAAAMEAGIHPLRIPSGSSGIFLTKKQINIDTFRIVDKFFQWANI